ncbi:class I adenylate-forming enzyme family protein [Roseibium album]|uniref:class I adenylate-forming enzyme family protein n=1 Tax=Roseibium album TaxID=311410 RepID=UPI002493AF5B|nr:class I adenylate-forming enzyme family protein [Roseibium album]
MECAINNTLWGWLQHHAETIPEAPATISASGTKSYGELAGEVRSAASGLQALGLSKGDVVAVQLPNLEAFVVTFLAVAACGGIVQTLHMPYRRAELSHLLEHSGARFAVGLSAFKDLSPAGEMLECAQALTTLEQVISVGEPIEGAVSLSTLSSSGAIAGDTEELPDLTRDDPFLLLYTSGTTASPKGVPHSYRGFLGNASNAASELAILQNETLLSVAPYTHLYGLFVMHLCLATGATQALLPSFSPDGFLPALDHMKPNGIFAAPAHFAPFCGRGLIKPEHLAPARFVCLSGSTVPADLARQVDGLMSNGTVIQLWGMSELQAGAFGRPGDPEEKRLTTAGRASANTLLRAVDMEGQVLEPGAEGELQVKGPSVFGGYLANPSETKAAFTVDGWFRTGDLAIVDNDGYLTLTGRVKEVINRGGVKYNPADVEAIISTLEAVEACAIVPYPDAILGEKACLCVQVREGASMSLEETNALLLENGIAKYKWPERLELVEAMPLTPTRKIMRGKLKQLIA